MSPASILHDDVIPSRKAIILIRNKRGHITERCGTPAVLFCDDQACSLKATPC